MASLDPQFAITPFTYPEAQELTPVEKLSDDLVRSSIVRLYEFNESQVTYLRSAIKVAYASGKFDGLVDMAKIGVAR